MDSRRGSRLLNDNKATTILSFSIIAIILGIVSIALQISSITIEVINIELYGYDVVGAGIWAGVINIAAGSLGWAASSQRTSSLLVKTVVLTVISLAASVVAATLSGIDYQTYYTNRCNDVVISSYYCDLYVGLEWSIMIVSIVALVSNATLGGLISMVVFFNRDQTKALNKL